MQAEFMMALGTFLSCCLTYFISVGCSYLKARISDVKQSAQVKQQELIKIGLETAAGAIEAAARVTVAKLEQAVGAQLKEAAKDGKVDKEEIYQLAENAYNEIMDTLSPEIIKLLQNGVQNVEKYIRSEIERQVFTLKHK